MAFTKINDLSAFFEDAEIFITGGSGVVGKALIESMLRMCNVRSIYVLLRPKRNFTVEERLEKIRKNMIFRRLKVEKPNELSKLIPIPGDATLPNLGITPEMAKQIENVSFLYHCAATVRFDEPLKVALQLNVGGTLEAIKLAKAMKYLKLFMHVSTFFSNPYVFDVEPKIYRSPMDWKFCLNLVKQNYNEDIINCLTKKMITGFPNTYTFTKNLAESLVNDYCNELPVAIVRPSVVLFSYRDPEPGFPTSLTGAMGLFAVVAAGLMKTTYIHEDVKLDVAPQDICVKLMSYYTYKAVEEYKHGFPSSAPVYNFSSYKLNDHSFKETASLMDTNNIWYKFALQKNLLLPGVIYTSNRFYYKFLYFTKQLSVALLVDGILMLCGRKPAIMAIMRKIFITLEVMQPFMFNNYACTKTNYDDFFEYTRGTPFTLEREYYYESHDQYALSLKMISGLREICLREDSKTIPQMQKIYQIKLVIYHLFRVFVIYRILIWLYRNIFHAYIQNEL